MDPDATADARPAHERGPFVARPGTSCDRRARRATSRVRRVIVDHVSIVTGANSGIGLAAALRLARAGKTVYGTARSGDGISRITQKASEAGCEVRAIAMDVTDAASVDRAV